MLVNRRVNPRADDAEPVMQNPRSRPSFLTASRALTRTKHYSTRTERLYNFWNELKRWFGCAEAAGRQRQVMAGSVNSPSSPTAVLRGEHLVFQRPLPANMGNGRSRPAAVTHEGLLCAPQNATMT